MIASIGTKNAVAIFGKMTFILDLYIQQERML